MPSLDLPSGSLDKADLSFLHLQVELMRVDLLIHRAIQLWQSANSERGLENFRGHYIGDAEITALLQKPLGANWWQPTEPITSDNHAEILRQADRQIQSLRRTASEQGKILRLDHLAATFGLTRFELDALLICLAPAFDRRYERFYGYLQDDATRKWVSVNLLLDLLTDPGPERLLRLAHFDEAAPLFRFHLLKRLAEPGVVEPPLLNQALRPDDSVVAWLLGRFRPHADLANYATLITPDDPTTDRLLVGEVLADLDRVTNERLATFVFHGRDDERQLAAARLLAAQTGQPLLRVDLAPALRAGLAPARVVALALRDARLNGALPCLTGWDAILTDNAPLPEVLAELYDHPERAVIAGREKWLSRGIERDHHMHWFEFPLPNFAHRKAVWEHCLQNQAQSNLDAVLPAGQFILTTGQIRDVVTLARDMAAQQGGALAVADLFAAARAQTSGNLGALARKITPRFDWADLVVPEDQKAMLHELVATVRSRPIVLDAWGVDAITAGNGITALFAGPPGTGKTMAAEVIAAELGLDLYKIDLSTLVSKYIGETEKNLEKIFKEAETSNAILFFDEADAIFGKRSEVRDSHDRYANIEISYLLQRMEAYDGVTILATNLRANLDEAFTRRLQFAVDFPFPEDDDRLRIWIALFPAHVPRVAELDLALMARKFKLAGGNIRNIIVTASFLAAADGGLVTMDHLMHGAKRELQKMGRLLNEKDWKKS